ncbi:MAG: polysaccharide lyase family 7 protein [Spirochaetales bacterium]|nr:polysaccharide lyase family 7 protein [Spirochaetales bacterium]
MIRKSLISLSAALALTVMLSGCLSSGSDTAAAEGLYPSDVLPSLVTNWKVTLPVDAAGRDSSDVNMFPDVDNRNNKAFEVALDDLKDYSYEPYFQVDDGGVRFRAHVAGATTKGSKYPRTELRQEYMGGNNYWSVDDYQQLHTKLKITETPKSKPEVCITQIHGPDDEPLRVQYHKDKGVYIVWNEKNKDYANALDYKLGQMLDITVTVENGMITCDIINEKTGDSYSKTWESSDKTGYFKVGVYTQSTKYLREYKGPSYQDEPEGAYGEVIVYELDVIEN